MIEKVSFISFLAILLEKESDLSEEVVKSRKYYSRIKNSFKRRIFFSTFFFLLTRKILTPLCVAVFFHFLLSKSKSSENYTKLASLVCKKC